MYRVSTLALVVAPMIVAQAANAAYLNKIWEIPVSGPGSRSYVATGDANRSITFNPVTKHVLIQGGSGTVPTVNIVSAYTGADIGTLNMTGVTGGARALSQIAVADDGAIYGTNVTTASNPGLKVYKWANESAAPVVVFDDTSSRLLGTATHIGGTAPMREGDSFAVRGSGASTQLLVGGLEPFSVTTANLTDNINRFGILSATDSTASTFSTQAFTVGSTIGGIAEYRRGLAFGNGDTIYSKRQASTLLTLTSYSPTVTTTTYSNAAQLVSGVSGLDVDMTTGLVATVFTASGANTVNQVRLFSLPASGTTLTFLESANFPGTGLANSSFYADIDIALIDGTPFIFALSGNNGVVAFVPEPASLVLLGMGSMLLVQRRRMA